MERLEQLMRHIKSPQAKGCKKLYEENWEIIAESPGSKANHQAWPGGYLDHLEQTIELSENLYPVVSKFKRLDFDLSDASLVLLLHDLEKPWKYVEGREFNSEAEKRDFVIQMAAKFKIPLSDSHLNALKYIHGEGRFIYGDGQGYSPNSRLQGELAAFVHCCDTLSARVLYDVI